MLMPTMPFSDSVRLVRGYNDHADVMSRVRVELGLKSVLRFKSGLGLTPGIVDCIKVLITSHFTVMHRWLIYR